MLVTDSHDKFMNAISYAIQKRQEFGVDDDLTCILNREDTIKLLTNINLNIYDEIQISPTFNEWNIISSMVKGDTTLFFIEDVFSETGDIKHDETDILLIPSDLPLVIRKHLFNEGTYNKLIEFKERSLRNELMKTIRN